MKPLTPDWTTSEWLNLAWEAEAACGPNSPRRVRESYIAYLLLRRAGASTRLRSRRDVESPCLFPSSSGEAAYGRGCRCDFCRSAASDARRRRRQAQAARVDELREAA